VLTKDMFPKMKCMQHVLVAFQ